MRISVVIPTYNSETKIGATLDAVLQQTVKPYEILIIDDGSTDGTSAVLGSYKQQITFFSQANQGIAKTRNELCARAKGDLVAFLDHDDIWHPAYLETQSRVFKENPDAAALFMGHVNFYGDESYKWDTDPTQERLTVERIAPLDFLRRYNQATGPFSSLSYCCVPLDVLRELGSEPFKESGTDDSYCLSAMTLLRKPFVLASPALVAYRIHAKSASQNHAETFGNWVRVFELLQERFQQADPAFRQVFQLAFAAKRRAYAKFLLGNGRVEEARSQLSQSLSESSNPTSLAKSFGMLSLSYFPRFLQPAWPSGQRELKQNSLRP